MIVACLLLKDHVTAHSSMATSVVVVADLGTGSRAVSVDQEVGAALGSAGASMAPSMVVVVGVGVVVRAGVDGGAATTGAVVGVEDAGEVGEDDGMDDHVADARVLRVLHIPAFASSIICSRRCICASMAETDSVDPAIPRHLVADPHDLDEHGDFLDRWLRYQMSQS